MYDQVQCTFIMERNICLNMVRFGFWISIARNHTDNIFSTQMLGRKSEKWIKWTFQYTITQIDWMQYVTIAIRSNRMNERASKWKNVHSSDDYILPLHEFGFRFELVVLGLLCCEWKMKKYALNAIEFLCYVSTSPYIVYTTSQSHYILMIK